MSENKLIYSKYDPSTDYRLVKRITNSSKKNYSIDALKPKMYDCYIIKNIHHKYVNVNDVFKSFVTKSIKINDKTMNIDYPCLVTELEDLDTLNKSLVILNKCEIFCCRNMSSNKYCSKCDGKLYYNGKQITNEISTNN